MGAFYVAVFCIVLFILCSDLMAYLKSLRPVYSFLEVATESFMQHVSHCGYFLDALAKDFCVCRSRLEPLGVF